MKIIKYELKYKSTLVQMFEDFHNDMVFCDPSGMVKPFSKKEHVFQYVDKMINDSKNMNGFIFLAIAKNTPVGFVQGVIFDHKKDGIHKLVSKPGSQGWIGELYVDSLFRNQSIGKLLFKKAKEHFVKNNCTAVCLNVFDGNKGAMRLYHELGMIMIKHEMDLKL